MKPYIVKTLALVGGILLLWFGGKAIFELWNFFHLNAHTPATAVVWSVEEQGPRVFLTGSYDFEVQGKKYQGKSRLQEPIFLNKFAAESAINSWGSHPWSIWYDSGAPDRSSLQKLFPYKNCIYALIIFGVCGYYFIVFSRASLKKVK
ncbi:MAG: hypothetical protein ACHQT8_00800 [Chlamydiales bacterium]